ncbi:MAG: tetratricopeptide repeat protein [Bdellovibrionota bacterium]
MGQTKYHPLIYAYLKKYQDDPTSRVFAPLAEAYRKAGLVDEAIEVAREGLRVHPAFVGGKVALARALFDKRQYAEVIEELKAVVEDAPDNLAAQRLVADSSLMLGRVADALGSYKMLLYFAPQDIETARLVHELEAQAYQDGTLVLEFTEHPAQDAIGEDPEVKLNKWIFKVERLQDLLQRVERYRHRVS